MFTFSHLLPRSQLQFWAHRIKYETVRVFIQCAEIHNISTCFVYEWYKLLTEIIWGKMFAMTNTIPPKHPTHGSRVLCCKRGPLLQKLLQSCCSHLDVRTMMPWLHVSPWLHFNWWLAINHCIWHINWIAITATPHPPMHVSEIGTAHL